MNAYSEPCLISSFVKVSLSAFVTFCPSIDKVEDSWLVTIVGTHLLRTVQYIIIFNIKKFE